MGEVILLETLIWMPKFQLFLTKPHALSLSVKILGGIITKLTNRNNTITSKKSQELSMVSEGHKKVW